MCSSRTADALFDLCAVALLCLVTFRSWRAVLVAVLPLAPTTVLAESLMIALATGAKVARCRSSRSAWA